MTLKERIDRELARLASVDELGAGVALTTDTPRGRLHVQLAAVDAIGCSFLSFTLKTDRLAGASNDKLRAVCDALSQRIGYLLEPIATIESDAQSCTIQMRSNPPQVDPQQTSYYELVVRRGGELSLCRYAKKQGTPRSVVPAQVTREVLHRLATDFDTAVS